MVISKIKNVAKKYLGTSDLVGLDDALTYIDNYWEQLTKSNKQDQGTLIGLPYPYIVPASDAGVGFSFEEQYYWDSYFTAIGLVDDKHQVLVEGMLENLLVMYRRFGLIPNASRMYFTSRSQPPILTSFIFHVFDTYNKDSEWLRSRIGIAMDEYNNVWMSQAHPTWHNVHNGLSRYYDVNVLHDLAEAESGWDMTPRFERKCLDYLPIDLNALLYKYEIDFARACLIDGDESGSKRWQDVAKTRQSAMHELMWGKLRGFFFDYNYERQTLGDIWSLAGYMTMWSGMASPEQAKRLVDNLPKFEKAGGLTTTAKPFIDTNLIFGSLKTQWAYPNGWAPLHYFVIEGLEQYGYSQEAQRIAKSWVTTNLNWFNRHGVFLEKYNVVNPKKRPLEGVYPSQTGFGWTNAIFTKLVEDYGLAGNK